MTTNRTRKYCLCEMDWLLGRCWDKCHIDGVKVYNNPAESCPVCRCYYWDFANEGSMLLWQLALSTVSDNDKYKRITPQ